MLKNTFKSSSPKNQWPKPEYLRNETYSFSANPLSQPIPGQCNAFLEWYGEQRQFFKDLRFCKVSLYCEVSSQGKLHFHGFIRVKHHIKFYIHDVPRINERYSTEMDTIGNSLDGLFDAYAEWIAYCNKVQPLMQEYMTEEIYGPFNKENLLYKNEDGMILINT